MQKGFLIAVEGVDGSGKSTLTEHLTKRFRAEYPEVGVRQTADPEGTATARLVKAWIDSEDDLADETTMLLIAAARKENCDKVISPALERGEIVITDRWLLSTLVYFCKDNKWMIRLANQIHGETCDNVNPHFTLVLSCDPGHAKRRLAVRLSLIHI